MFRVQENDDGTTVVYCNTSGKQIFVLRGDHQPRIPHRINVRIPINVVEPSRHSDLSKQPQTSDDDSIQPYSSDQDKDSDSSNEKVCFPVCLDDITEDFFNESATKSEFARSLNLVPQKRFKKEALSEINKDFPLRLLSRSKSFRRKDGWFEEQRHQKLPDDLPLSSKLGIRFLKLNKSQNYLTPSKLSIVLKKYDSFCRFPFNTPNPAECNFPKLRCREKYAYPTSSSSKALKHEATHVYTYGRRQRRDRMRTLETGLDRHSRALLRLCNSKRCSVVLKRLPESEVKYWRARKREPILIVIDDSDDEAPSAKPANKTSKSVTDYRKESYNAVSSKKVVAVQSEDKKNISQENVFLNKNATVPPALCTVLNTQTSSESVLPVPAKPSCQKSVPIVIPAKSLTKLKGLKDCSVRLTDVSNLLYRTRGEYFVKSTTIHVPFYANFLTSLSFRKGPMANRSLQKIERPRSLSVGQLCVESYRKNLSKTQAVQSSNSKPTAHSRHRQPFQTLDPLFQPRSFSAPLESKLENGSSDLQIIPVVDLTEDSSPEREAGVLSIVHQDYYVAEWLFRCYACGARRLFNNNHAQASSIVHDAVCGHMKKFHYVDKPEAFLSSYLDTLNNRSIIEAFPGYKAN